MASCSLAEALPCSGNGVCDPATLQCLCNPGYGSVGDMLAHDGQNGCNVNQAATLALWAASLTCGCITLSLSLHRSWVAYQRHGKKIFRRDVPQFQLGTTVVASLVIAASAMRISSRSDAMIGLSPASTYLYFASCVGIMLFGCRIVYIFYHAVARRSAFNLRDSSYNNLFTFLMWLVYNVGCGEFAMSVVYLYVSPSQGLIVTQVYSILMGITSVAYASVVLAFTSKVLSHLKAAVLVHPELANLLFGLRVVRTMLLCVPFIMGISSFIIGALLPSYPVMIAYKVCVDYLFMAMGMFGVSSFLALAVSTGSSRKSKRMSKELRGSRSGENALHPAGAIASRSQLSTQTHSPISEVGVRISDGA